MWERIKKFFKDYWEASIFTNRRQKMEIDFTKKIIEAKEKKTLNKPFRTPGGPKKF